MAAENQNIQMKQWNGTEWNDLYPVTKWENIVNQPVIPKPDLREMYPVGSIYMSSSETSPASFVGGVWQRLYGVFLFGGNDSGTYQVGNLGGEDYHTLTVEEMPSHRHEFQYDGRTFSGFPIGNAGGDVNYMLGNSSVANRVTIAETGGGVAHNNMPPYLCVRMWVRVE